MRGDVDCRTGRAYVTVLSTDGYLEGVLALNQSLRLCKATYPLYVVVGSRVSTEVRELVGKAGIRLIIAQPVDIPEKILFANASSDSHKHWGGVFEKLLIFSLCDFEKIVYIDADMFVIKNIDHLLDRNHMSAVVADIYPGGIISSDFNAGLIVIAPEPGLTERLLATIGDVFEKETQWRRAEGRPVSMGMQSVINEFWSDWSDNVSLHLDGKYNVLVNHVDYYVRSLGYRWRGSGGIHALHFIGQEKPWMRSPLQSAQLIAGLLIRRRKAEAVATLAYLAILQAARVRLSWRSTRCGR